MTPVDVPRSDVRTLLVCVGAFVVVVGAVLPWLVTDYVGANAGIDGLSVETESPLTSGDTLVIGAAACVFLATLAPRRFGPAFVLGTLGVLIVFVGGCFVLAPGSITSGTAGVGLSTPAVTVGIGPYVTLLGGVGVLAGSLLWYATADLMDGSEPPGDRPGIGRYKG